MNHGAARYLIYSQLSLLLFLSICTVLMPGFLFSHNEGGMSNYGIHALTVVPYTLAFLLCSICIVRAASLLPLTSRYSHNFRYGLYAAACLFFLVLVTTYPYKTDNLFANLHIAVTVTIFWFQTALAFWMTWRVLKDTLSISIFAIELVGFGLAFFTFINSLHVLFIAQIITGAAFGTLLVRTAQRLAQ